MNFSRTCLTCALLALAACSPVRTSMPPPPAPSVIDLPAAPLPAPAPVPVISEVPQPAVVGVSAGPALARVHPMHGHAASASASSTPARAPASAAADTLDLHGRLTLVAAGNQALAPGERVDSVVYYVPASGAPAPRAGRFDIYTINRDFKPAAMAVPLGSTVRFVNQDEVRHNVFSVTPGDTFDLGYQAPGQAAEQVLGHAGLVLVSCNVHRSMETDVLVVPSAYAAKVAADGRFVLRGLPPGPGKLYYWNPRGRLGVLAVTLPASAEVAVRVEAVRPRVLTEIDVGTTP